MTLAETLGRRNALLANGVFNVAAALLEYLAKPADSPEFLIVGRLILGANMGLSTSLVPMYLMEITPCAWRGAAGTIHMVSIFLFNSHKRFILIYLNIYFGKII
jgi:MFS family permease